MDRKWRNRLILIAIISAVIGGLFAAFVVPWLSKNISGWGNNELLTVITLLTAVITFGVPFIEIRLHTQQAKKDQEQAKKDQKSVYQIDIQVDTSLPNNMVRFSATIQNVGHKRIATRFSNLYIDEGVQAIQSTSANTTAVKYEFPFILEHKVDVNGRPDCILCTKLRQPNTYNEDNLHYPTDALNGNNDKFKNIFHTNVFLEHLSDKSIKYIDPQEKFSEDVVMQFKKAGVYRVTFIVMPCGDEVELEYGACDADCECATKQFYIPVSLADDNH